MRPARSARPSRVGRERVAGTGVGNTEVGIAGLRQPVEPAHDSDYMTAVATTWQQRLEELSCAMDVETIQTVRGFWLTDLGTRDQTRPDCIVVRVGDDGSIQDIESGEWLRAERWSDRDILTNGRWRFTPNRGELERIGARITAPAPESVPYGEPLRTDPLRIR